ncbi:hypothetical protein [Christiangramia crocea]|uniref:Uncharacterized protein n=1 Tax=Christiangramia crocea TaxID=2904124 RepID=A0A9X2A9I4_9FLAO|nr:hypothetical protein [Gramella crocea]MCG9972933.1 hypothetical protein [Gramella crocea]
MKFEKLGDFIYIPKHTGTPLKGKKNIKFNYYLSSRVNGKLIDLDITTKLFDEDQMFIRKACYRVKLGEIENCVKANLLDHMKSLGMDESNIPESLMAFGISSRAVRSSNQNAFSD